MNVKDTIKKIGILGIMVLFFAACDKVEDVPTPVVTDPPKVLLVDAATPTPTFTPENGEVPPTPTMKPEISTAPEVTPAVTPESTPQPTATVTPEASQAPETTQAPTATPTPIATATPKPTPKPTATPKPTKAPEAVSYEKGKLTETGYESKWMGLRFVPEGDMELVSQEELDATMRLLYEALYEKTAPEKLPYEKLPVVYEMELVWQSEGLTMQVLVELLEDSSMTEEAYAAQLEEELILLEEMDFSYDADFAPYQEYIAGLGFTGFGYTTYFSDEVSLRQQNYMRKQGDRMIVISVMGETEDAMQYLLSKFTSY